MRTPVRRLAMGAASLLCLASTVACSGGDGGADKSGATAPTGEAATPPQSSPPPEPPKPRGPVLHVKNGSYPYTVQMVSARLTTDSPNGVPARAGLTYLQLQIVVRSDLPGRPVMSPNSDDLSVIHPACEDDVLRCIGMEYGTDYYTGEQVASGNEGKTPGVEPLFGKLEPDNPYYSRVWGNVREDTDLSGAELCDGAEKKYSSCIPLGDVDTA